MSRLLPGKSSVRKSAVMPKAKTSTSISSTIRASLLDLVTGVELGLVADEVVDAGARRGPVDDRLPEVEVVADLEGARRQTEPRA